jgi:hypothetical protein
MAVITITTDAETAAVIAETVAGVADQRTLVRALTHSDHSRMSSAYRDVIHQLDIALNDQWAVVGRRIADALAHGATLTADV